jgi:hypothetical protein
MSEAILSPKLQRKLAKNFLGFEGYEPASKKNSGMADPRGDVLF